MTALHTKPQLSTIEVRKPADGSLVGEVAVDSPEVVAAKAEELRLHQPEWEAMGARGRKRWLLAFQDWMLDNAESITDLVQAESGKATAEALLEPTMSADIVGYWARNAADFLADESSEAAHPADEDQAADHRAPSLSRSGPDHSVELPVHERGGRRGARARRRRRVAAQAVGGDAAVRRRVRARLGRNRRATGTRVGARLRRHGRRGDRELRLRAVHRFDGNGPQGRRRLRGAA